MLECLEKLLSGIVEYFEVLKTQIAFGKDTLTFQKKGIIFLSVHHQHILKVSKNSSTYGVRILMCLINMFLS